MQPYVPQIYTREMYKHTITTAYNICKMSEMSKAADTQDNYRLQLPKGPTFKPGGFT